ncbi:hypothetical protein [Methylophaga sp.]|uniref:DUF6998 domain-containing protein n=1 Tax=Methylophaga sp. TaxID=2024840 RepID=UPI0025EEC857|nr:hypothetical protein [Methylophaga sp.]
MSDWDFLHDMHKDGCSPEQITDAAACGYNPWDFEYIDIDREWIDSQLPDPGKDQPRTAFKSRDGFPYNALEQAEIFHDLIDCATRHFENTGRYLQIWGELGEIYAEIKFGLRRHGTHEAGSDGTINGELVEVKTISPEKNSSSVLVKTQGNFEKVLVIRIDEDFQCKGKLFDRTELKGGSGKYLRGQLDIDGSNS